MVTLPFWKPTHQARKSLQDFLSRIPALMIRPKVPPAPPPTVPLVVRVGAAGPLLLGSRGEELRTTISAVLAGLRTYTIETANPRFHRQLFASASPGLPAEMRLVSQLASGFDQLAAAAATENGYKLHLVLPGSRPAFRNDIRTNCGPSSTGALDEPSAAAAADADDVSADALSHFDRIIANADRVLELDRDDESSDTSALTMPDYAQAGAVILDHCDIVMLVVHDEKAPALGGTRWMEQRAEERGLTVVLVPFEKPSDAMLIWTFEGRRESRKLFNRGLPNADPQVFAAALDRGLLGPSFDVSKTQPGWLELRMIAQLDPAYNAGTWDERWKVDASDALAKRDLGGARQQIDGDLKAAKVWADQHASALAELVRGSFIFCAVLGALAVAGALLGVIFPGYSEVGKCLELLFLGLILSVMWRSHRYNWRSQWLSLRQLERYLEQAGWLILVGRSRTYATPSHLTQFERDEVALWTNAYFRALLRNCSFPTARFTADYLKTVHSLVLRNLVVNQIEYFDGEIELQRKSNTVLEGWTRVCVAAAAAITGLYLLAEFWHWVAQFLPHTDEGTSAAAQNIASKVGGLLAAAAAKLSTESNTVAALGALLTAVAATLSAVRNHGEYAQIANRYEGARNTLQGLQAQLAARLPDRRPSFSSEPMRSAALESFIGAATDVVTREVQGWHAILQTKEIEPL